MMGHIFAVPGHIDQIKAGTKTQTRRLDALGTTFTCDYDGNIIAVYRNGRLQYRVGGVYRALPGRGKRGECSYRITRIRLVSGVEITPDDALAEGGYTPDSYRALLLGLYGKLPDTAIAYTFEYVP